MDTVEFTAAVIAKIEEKYRVVRINMDTDHTIIYLYTRYPPRVGGGIQLPTAALATPTNTVGWLENIALAADELVDMLKQTFPRFPVRSVVLVEEPLCR